MARNTKKTNSTQKNKNKNKNKNKEPEVVSKAAETTSYEFTESLTNTAVEVIYTSNMQETYDILCKQYPFFKSNSMLSYTGFCIYNLYYLRRIYILLDAKAPVSALSHEAVHAMDGMMDFFGFEGSEFRAYGVGAIVELVYPS